METEVIPAENKNGPVDKKSGTRMHFLLKVLLLLLIVSLIRIFIIDSYKITSDSMEGELLVGDNVFVTKFNYGARVPSSIGIPFIGNRSMLLSMFGLETHTASILPYMRLPALSQVKRNEIIAFNFPLDRVPLNFRTTFIKRCVGLPGDRIEIREGKVLINGNVELEKIRYQKKYMVHSNKMLTRKEVGELGWNDFNTQLTELKSVRKTDDHKYLAYLDEATYRKLKALPSVQSINPVIEKKNYADLDVYPYDLKSGSNKDHISAWVIPSEKQSIKLDTSNAVFYYRIIRDFEGLSDVSWKNQQIYHKGKALESYTFKQNYYYALGDNRGNSVDSRYWGVVPEDHLIGKVYRIWFSRSLEGKLRWDRIFNAPD